MNDTSNVQAVNNAQPSVNANSTGVAPAAPVNNSTAPAPVASAPTAAPAPVATPAPVAAPASTPAATPAQASTPASVVTPAPAPATAATTAPAAAPVESSTTSSAATTEPEKKVEEQPNNNEEEDDDDDYAVGGNRKIPIILSLVFVGLMGILAIYYYVFFTAERVFTKIVDAAILNVDNYVEKLDMSTVGKKQLKFNVTATIPGMEFEGVTGQTYAAVLSADLQKGTYGIDINGELKEEEILNAHLYNIGGSLYAKIGTKDSPEIIKYDHNYDLGLGTDKEKIQSILGITKTFINYAFFDESTASSRTISRTLYRDKVADQTLTGLKTTYSISEKQFVVLVKDFAGSYAQVSDFINPLAELLNMDATELTHHFNNIANDFNEAHSIKIEFFTNLATTKILGVGLQFDDHYFKFNNLYDMIFVNYSRNYVNDKNENVTLSIDFNIDPYENYQETTTITLADSYMYVQRGLEVKLKKVGATEQTVTATRITYKDGLVKETKEATETKKDTLIDMYGLETDNNDKAFTSLGVSYTFNNNVKEIGVVAPENGVSKNSLSNFISSIKNNEMIKKYLETNNVIIVCIFENEGKSMQPGDMPGSISGGGMGAIGTGGMMPGTDPNAGVGVPGMNSTTTPNTGETNVGGVQVQPGGATTAPNTGETNVGGVQVQPGGATTPSTGTTQPSGTPSTGDTQTGTVPSGTPPAGMPPA